MQGEAGGYSRSLRKASPYHECVCQLVRRRNTRLCLSAKLRPMRGSATKIQKKKRQRCHKYNKKGHAREKPINQSRNSPKKVANVRGKRKSDVKGSSNGTLQTIRQSLRLLEQQNTATGVEHWTSCSRPKEDTLRTGHGHRVRGEKIIRVLRSRCPRRLSHVF